MKGVEFFGGDWGAGGGSVHDQWGNSRHFVVFLSIVMMICIYIASDVCIYR